MSCVSKYPAFLGDVSGKSFGRLGAPWQGAGVRGYHSPVDMGFTLEIFKEYIYKIVQTWELSSDPPVILFRFFVTVLFLCFYVFPIYICIRHKTANIKSIIQCGTTQKHTLKYT